MHAVGLTLFVWEYCWLGEEGMRTLVRLSPVATVTCGMDSSLLMAILLFALPAL